ncbi:3-keto-5-aminohexanoate cleavage protein [Pseudochelatococcus sp. B33]
MKPTILTCAITGNHTTREHHPGLPVTPKEIADACIDAGKAGAAIAHIHVRDPDTGSPSIALEHYEEVVKRIRDSGSDILINLTTGPGGRYQPSPDDPAKPGPRTMLLKPEKRVEHIVTLKPDICSLDLNTMWFGPTAVINAPSVVREMARLMYEAGVKPELEVFDSGDIALAHDLIADGTLRGPTLFQIVLGVKYGATASPASLMYSKSLLPDDCVWAAFGVGRHSFPMVAQATLLGGHCRVGLEDNVYISKGVLARDNAELVERAVSIIESIGGKVATAAEARAELGLAV